MKPAKPITIPGPAGQLQLAISTQEQSPKAVVVISHPHPLHGGTMNNKVVTTLARTFLAIDCDVVRFNFRGVGESEGQFDEGRGEAEDLKAVIAWVSSQYPSKPIWLAGFSFGSFISLKVANQIPIARLITIAPPVGRFEFATLATPDCPWLVVHGDLDELFAIADVLAWHQQLSPQPILIRLPEASHFFHGQLIPLKNRIIAAISG